jgi:hypothetical protein
MSETFARSQVISRFAALETARTGDLLGAITEKGEAPRWLRLAQATLRKFRSLKFSQFGSTDGITAGVIAWVAAVSIQPHDAEFRIMPDRTVSPHSASPAASCSVQAIDRNVPEPWLLLLF